MHRNDIRLLFNQSTVERDYPSNLYMMYRTRHRLAAVKTFVISLALSLLKTYAHCGEFLRENAGKF